MSEGKTAAEIAKRLKRSTAKVKAEQERLRAEARGEAPPVKPPKKKRKRRRAPSFDDKKKAWELLAFLRPQTAEASRTSPSLCSIGECPD